MNGKGAALLVIAACGAFAAGNDDSGEKRTDHIPPINPSDSVSHRILAQFRVTELREILASLRSEEHLDEIPWLETADRAWLRGQLRGRPTQTPAAEEPQVEEQ